MRRPTAARSSTTWKTTRSRSASWSGLSYSNPYLSPYEEFQRYKTHPEIRKFFEGGKRISYGARAITAGGLQSLPKLVFPGGALHRLRRRLPQRVSRIKGSHAAMKSGMLAAEAAFEALGAERQHDELTRLSGRVPQRAGCTTNCTGAQLQAVHGPGPVSSARSWSASTRCCSAARRHGRCATSTRTTRCCARQRQCKPIEYPKPDGKLTFDRLSSVFISNTNHDEDQPAHLTLKDPNVPVEINLAQLCGAGAALLPGRRVRVS